jgi:cytochrome c peroxidase
MKKRIFFWTIAALASLFSACTKKDPAFEAYYGNGYSEMFKHLNLPDYPLDYAVKSPFFGLRNGDMDNDDIATLGRVLFYDTKLSKDGKISCASCHQQSLAFGDDKAFSEGVFGRVGERNSIALSSVPSFAADYGTDLNGANGKRFFWDNRAPTAGAQSRASMENPSEMDMTMKEIIKYVETVPFYKPLFFKAFGDERVTEGRVTESIASFVNSMSSLNSKFDWAVSDAIHGGKGLGKDFSAPLARLSEQENRGRALYLNSCAGCHSDNLTFSPLRHKIPSNAGNGLDERPADAGVGSFTRREEDMGTFKIPTLRNIALTGPYMHDGRFETLDQVLDFYSTGIQPQANLHPLLKKADGTPKRFKFTAEEKYDLIAFLATLTDEKILVDVRFSDPFKR